MKILARFFFALCGLITTAYAVTEYYGWEPAPTHAQRIDPNLRKSPGGFRSYTFWHQGTHGGK